MLAILGRPPPPFQANDLLCCAAAGGISFAVSYLLVGRRANAAREAGVIPTQLPLPFYGCGGRH